MGAALRQTEGRRDGCIAVALLALACAGCAGLLPRFAQPASVGFPEDGVLLGGVPLPLRGEGYVLARPGDDTRFALPGLVGAIERAAVAVARSYPGGAPLRVGDLSGPLGGQHSRHHSHRTGRDVDLIFYVTDGWGRARPGSGALRFDEHGVIRPSESSGDVLVFDDARNWLLVRSLLTDPQVHVQWIFCSAGVKARLLRYAAATEQDPGVIFRATWTLHEPSNGREHDDHFHVRVACSASDRASGCADHAPVWSWLRRDAEKPSQGVADPLSDEVLVSSLLSDPATFDAVAVASSP